MSCQKAQEFLESVGASIKQAVDARKLKIGPDEALALAAKADRVRVVRGKKAITFDMKAGQADDAVLLEHLIGRTGMLRAPAALIGRTLVVGFNPDVYREILGA